MSKEMITLFKHLEDACEYIDSQAKTSVRFADFLRITMDAMIVANSKSGGNSDSGYFEGILGIDFCPDQRDPQRLSVYVNFTTEDRKSVFCHRYECIIIKEWLFASRGEYSEETSLFTILLMNENAIWRSNYNYWLKLRNDKGRISRSYL